jgi:hypothetical protein
MKKMQTNWKIAISKIKWGRKEKQTQEYWIMMTLLMGLLRRTQAIHISLQRELDSGISPSILPSMKRIRRGSWGVIERTYWKRIEALTFSIKMQTPIFLVGPHQEINSVVKETKHRHYIQTLMTNVTEAQLLDRTLPLRLHSNSKGAR